MISQEIPVPVTQQCAIHRDQWIGAKLTFTVDRPGKLFFAGTCLAGQHNRESCLIDMFHRSLKGGDGTGNAVKTAGKAFLGILTGGILNSVFSGGKGNLIGRKVKCRIIFSKKSKLSAAERIKDAIQIFKKLLCLPVDHRSDFMVQNSFQRRRNSFFKSRKKQVSVFFQDNDLLTSASQNITLETIL